MTNQEFLNELRECNHSSCDTECLEKEVCKKYLEIKEILMDIPKTKTSRDIHKSYKKSLTKIDTVLLLLPKQEYEYIVKTFITKVRTGWWKEIYKTDEYEKLKNVAIKRFIYLYLI